MTKKEQRQVVVIGAGIGGLSAAIRLAVNGYDVSVYEKNEQVGGKMGQWERDGYRWDMGPSVITMRHVLEDLFTVAGRKMEDYLTLEPVEPLTRYFYPDGTRLDVTRDWPRLAEQIAALDERDVTGYLDFLAYAAEIHRITGPVFIYDQPPTWRSFLGVPPRDMLKVDGLRTMDRAIRSFVHSPHLRQLLGRFATYVGASPYKAPATLSVIAHVELTGGVWYPRGGIYAIATSLARLAEEVGVIIHTATPVTGIETDGKRVAGVVLESGERIPADGVIANVDVATVYEELLPPAVATPERVRAMTEYDPSCSGFVLLLGVERTHPELAHHNIFFSADYRREFADIFERGMPPEDPTIYVSITSKRDAGHAPAGAENWFVLVNAPPLGPRYDWQINATAYRRRVLAALARHGYDIADHVVVERVLTPHDIATMTGAYRGALYGISSNSRWSAFRRPHNRSRDVPGLYFAGGTAHPGGGVPMVTLSGKVAADLLREDTPA